MGNYDNNAWQISRMYSKEIHIFYLQKEMHDSDLPPTVVRRVGAARQGHKPERNGLRYVTYGLSLQSTDGIQLTDYASITYSRGEGGAEGANGQCYNVVGTTGASRGSDSITSRNNNWRWSQCNTDKEQTATKIGNCPNATKRRNRQLPKSKAYK